MLASWEGQQAFRLKTAGLSASSSWTVSGGLTLCGVTLLGGWGLLLVSPTCGESKRRNTCVCPELAETQLLSFKDDKLMSSLTTSETLSKYPTRATPVWNLDTGIHRGRHIVLGAGLSHPKSSGNVLPPTSDFHVLFLPPGPRCSAPFRSRRALHPQGPPPRPGLEGFGAGDRGQQVGGGGRWPGGPGEWLDRRLPNPYPAAPFAAP